MTTTATGGPGAAPVEAAGAPPPPVRRRRRPRTPYLLLVPAVAVLLLGLGYPVYWQVVTSMQEFGLAQQFGTAPPEFVGLANYVEIFTSDVVWVVVARSVAFCLVNAFLAVGIGTLLALLMKGVGTAPRLALQVALLLAWAMPMVAAVTVWKWLFDWRQGVVNWLLVQIGLGSFENHNWLAQPLSFFFVATVIVTWMSVPFVALSVYAALTQVSDEVLEAAALDGASGAKRFFYIILPIVRPVVSIVLLLQIIWDLRVFAQIRLLQDAGAPVSETNLLGNFIYELGIGRQDFAGAAAVSLFVLALTIVLSWPYVRTLLKEDES
ncbi:carbohydrate ABC transporter permease [Cellulomonas sp. PhB143]|uniref:carbohydrate ABC transporter permease n=1 Tax=Cellulomonas sp. PhB143 TaxID=2485186 RepID=UPI000F468B2C|nr:sugar ABC transporter permease [Cellulomonas sp. PhB143]ROS77001.1 carbohydrate ABC transporter membrane protein 1 (CUT1 family) [Cellulomonas sp. PhB143]